MKRLVWIDDAKAIGIFLVILAHTQIWGSVTDWISVFRMPLFFFLSGYLFSFQRNSDGKLFARKRFKQIVIPYIFINIITYLFWLLVSSHYGVSADEQLTPWYGPIVAALLCNGKDMVHNIPKASKEKKCNCARTGNKECSVKAKDDVMSRWKARSIALRLFGDKESFGILNSRICLYWSKMLIVERISKDPNRKVFYTDEIIKEMVDIFTEILMTYPVHSTEMSDALKVFINNFFICVDDSGNPIGYQILSAIMSSIKSCQMFAE